jgi:FlaA1/EpsC-like NDP-sugar epimerase
MRGPFANPRNVLIVIHDLIATAAAILAAFYFRFEATGLADRFDWLMIILPGYLVYAGVVYWIFNLHVAKWRFVSLPDLWNIFRASTVLAFSLLVLD